MTIGRRDHFSAQALVFGGLGTELAVLERGSAYYQRCRQSLSTLDYWWGRLGIAYGGLLHRQIDSSGS